MKLATFVLTNFVFLVSLFNVVLCQAKITYNSTIVEIVVDDVTIIGRVNNTGYKNTTYFSFMGIRYAEPPIGDLRFRPPVPLPFISGNKTVNAIHDRCRCIQPKELNIKGSEDCLSLNVYTPKTLTEPLPVLVYIYGGTFITGSDHFKEFDPVYFLDEDIIVVTINYRLGIFGFLSTEDYASPGNYGLKDQALALKWVHKNIKYFNGDPEKITINGQSAGASSVTYMVQSPLTAGLYRSAIIESGSSLTLWSLTRTARQLAFTTGYLLGIITGNSYTLVSELRKVDYKTLQQKSSYVYTQQIVWGNPLDGLPFGPTIEPPHPGAILTDASHHLISQGLFNKVNFLIGFNSLEAFDFVKDGFNNIPIIYWRYDIFPTTLVPYSMNMNNEYAKIIVDERIRRHYFNGMSVLASSTKEKSVFLSDDEFVRPIVEVARLYSQYSPLYLYTFSYKSTADRNALGVAHGEELQYLWRSMATVNSSENILTTKRMVKLWTNFVKTGNPTPTKDSLFENVTWPLSNSTGNYNLAYLDIGEKLVAGINPHNRNVLFWRTLFEEYGRPPYSTY